MKKIILISILVLVIGGILLTWQNFLAKEKVEHPTITETKYFGCMKKCNLEYPNIDNTQADSLIKFTEKQENKKCKFSCQEKYGISLPLFAE